MVRQILFGVPVVLGRTNDGKAFALRDICPHRGAPLSAGRITEDGCVECPYHGWQFRFNDGGCNKIPALSATDSFESAGIAVQTFPLYEANGLIWIFNGNAKSSGGNKGIGSNALAPEIGLPASYTPKNITTVTASGPYDEAVIGLVDPAHTPFVHKQWWWREGSDPQEKTKQFEATALGFRMPPHRPSSNSRIYGFLGGTPTTEIEFRLPGLRLETIRNRQHIILGLTTITPNDSNQNTITHIWFWDIKALTILKPLIKTMAKNFLAQDGAILDAQNKNLNRQAHRPLYAGEPDIPAQWYYKLKKSWGQQQDTEDFCNPLSNQTLHWRT